VHVTGSGSSVPPAPTPQALTAHRSPQKHRRTTTTAPRLATVAPGQAVDLPWRHGAMAHRDRSSRSTCRSPPRRRRQGPPRTSR